MKERGISRRQYPPITTCCSKSITHVGGGSECRKHTNSTGFPFPYFMSIVGTHLAVYHKTLAIHPPSRSFSQPGLLGQVLFFTCLVLGARRQTPCSRRYSNALQQVFIQSQPRGRTKNISLEV